MATASMSPGEAGLFARPASTHGVWGWITTVDHKRIGVLYGAASMAFLALGGFLALLIRLQLARPNQHLITGEAYNQLFTMHGLTMIFLVIMPLSAAFVNFIVPLQIGARDVAFPRLNALSFWVFLFGGLFLYSAFLVHSAPDGGWFCYAPNCVVSAGLNNTFYAIGLLMVGIGSMISALNLAVTIIQMRAPGMSWMRMPVFTWMSLVTQMLLVFALPIITVGLLQLLFDRRFGTHFFDPGAGGDPVLWQHMFWLFGHPEVYILILPAMGVVSEILPVFSRKPLFGYPFVVFSGIAIGFIGFGVWAHHMFTTGLGPVANAAFSISTMIIAVPTGVKIFNWLATLYKGDLRFKTPMLFGIGFIALFIIGGLSGVTHAVVVSDYQQHDSYYIVAHFHYVLFGGALMALMGGVYYWFPKVFGRMLSDSVGKLHFWLVFIGMNLTFGPMHILGIEGMPRRIYSYSGNMGWALWNMVETIGAFITLAGFLVFAWNILAALRRPRGAEDDPWDARTLEWATASPPPVFNFERIPFVHSRDELWHRKYDEDAKGHAILREEPLTDEAEEREGNDDGGAGGGGGGHAIHIPSPSYWPIVTALGLPFIGYGLMYNWWFSALGAMVLLAGVFGWILEPSVEPALEEATVAASH